MVTLTGPGGIGKTRLALRALGVLADDFPDGVRYVELADFASPISWWRGSRPWSAWPRRRTGRSLTRSPPR